MTGVFQLTTSRRGRRLNAPVHNLPVSTFQLTTSRRGRRIRLGYSFSLSYFNSLPHAEVDQKLQMLQQRWKYFNSLPHAEVDAEYDVISSGASKFQLTTSRRGRLLIWKLKS